MANDSLISIKYNGPDFSKFGQPAQIPTFVQLSKSLSDFLIPRQTNDANEGTFTARGSHPCIQLADGADELAFFSLFVPPDLTITSIKLLWTSPAASGNLLWEAAWVFDGEGNTVGTGSNVLHADVSATKGANLLNYTELNAGSPRVSDAMTQHTLWGLKFERTASSATDTLGDVVNIYGLLVFYK
jgi:hypothetical protein